MTDQTAKDDGTHEKIRFRKEEIVNLSAMPSAEGVPFPAKRLPRKGKALRWSVRIATLIAAIILGFLAFLQLLGLSGFGAQRLTEVAQSELRAFFGQNIDAAIGSARFSVRGPGILTLDLSDVQIAKSGSEDVAVTAETVRLRLNSWSVLMGRPRVSGASLQNAHILVGAMPGQSDSAWMSGLLNSDGLLDSDKVLRFVFDAADNASRLFATGAAPEVEISDVRFELPEGLPTRIIGVKSAIFRHQNGGVMLSGTANADTHNAEFEAEIVSNPHDGSAENFKLVFSTKRRDSETKSVSLGSSSVSLIGSRSKDGEPGQLEATIAGDGLAVDLGKQGILTGKLDILATLAPGTGKLELDRFNTTIGRSTFLMSGAIGPRQTQAGEVPAYRFELVSPNSTLAPEDSSEPDMPLSIKLAGSYVPNDKLISVENIGISSASGRAFGTAEVKLIDDGPPGISLALNVKDMSVSHVKQLWPWFAAGPARRWVNTNLFGGTVPSGSIHFAVVPGRLGNGQKLNESEVSGEFQVEQTRFDIAGLLPPVRDALGTVRFAGDNVDITLDSGKVFLSSGQSVAASGGRLTIDDARTRPVIGTLEVNVAGDASAIAGFASLEPINAMKNTGVAPESLSGPVEGTVKARIPMHKGIDRSLLSWDVDLAFKNLSVAEPIEGQKIANASGAITLDKEKAVIKADADLNGLPAELTLTEPLAQSDVPRQRDIVLVIDEDAQEKLSPSLDQFIAGTVRLAVTGQDNKRKRLEADLTAAKLNLPMVGWSKGEGVPAKLSFDIASGSDAIQISNFDLSGSAFAINGDMSIAGGGLRSANFNRFQLTRDDNVAVTIQRSGKGYAVNVSGASLDARALIRRAMQPDKKNEAGSSSVPISLKAKVDQVIGFNGVSLSGVELSYSAAGSITDLSLDATTGDGKTVTISNSPDGAGRRFRLAAQDAGSLLRFLDIYGRMQGGVVALSMAASGESYAGQLDLRNFWIVDEPKLGSIVSSAPSGSNRSLNEAVRGGIDTSRVQFERGFADIEKGPSYLRVGNGVLRGPMVGTTFKGTVYDENNQMDLTGTFMPAYGLNRIFGELPLIGDILGNGRDRGLIGVTYKLTGDVKAPRLQINPLSAIAPGIFRSIFEFQ